MAIKLHNFSDMKQVGNMDLLKSINRQKPFPIDLQSYYLSLTDAVNYIKNSDTAYHGQIITVVENGKVDVYKVDVDESGFGKLSPIVDAPKSIHSDKVDPSSATTNFEEGQMWLNTETNKMFVLLNNDKALNSANWQQIITNSDLQGKGNGDMLMSVYAQQSQTPDSNYGGYVDKSITTKKLEHGHNLQITGDVVGSADDVFAREPKLGIGGGIEPAITTLTVSLPEISGLATGDNQFYKVIVDSKGRVTAGETTLSGSEINVGGNINIGNITSGTKIDAAISNLATTNTALSSKIGALEGAQGDYVLKSALINVGGGSKDAGGKPIKTDADGFIDSSFIKSLNISNVYELTVGAGSSFEQELVKPGNTWLDSANMGDFCYVSGSSGLNLYILTVKDGARVAANWKKLDSLSETEVAALKKAAQEAAASASAAQASASAAQQTADTVKKEWNAINSINVTTENFADTLSKLRPYIVINGGDAAGFLNQKV